MQPLLQSTSRSFSSFQTETLSPLNISFPSSFPLLLATTILLLSLCTWLLLAPHLSGIAQYLSFSDWFISHTLISSSFFPVVAYARMSFLFKGELFHRMYIPHIVYPFTAWVEPLVISTFGLLWRTLLWPWCASICWSPRFWFSWVCTPSTVAGSYGNSVFNVLEELPCWWYCVLFFPLGHTM